MPNYKLSDYARSYVSRRLNELTRRHNEITEMDFPLTRAEVEAAVAPANIRGLLQELVKNKVSSVEKTSRVCCIIGDPVLIPRPALVHISVNPAIFYCYQEQDRSYADYKHVENIASLLPFDVASLGLESQAKLAKWLNAAVIERRRTRLTIMTVNIFMRDYCDNLYQFRARWPGISLLFKDADKWDARMREVPPNLNRWGWPRYPSHVVQTQRAFEWHTKNAKAMDVAERMLLSASMIRIDKDARQPRTGLPTAFVPDYYRNTGEPA